MQQPGLILFAIACLGCGPKAGGSDDSGGSTDSSASATDSDSGTSRGTGGGSGSGGTGAGVCDGFEDDPDLGPGVRVVLRNTLDYPVYLTQSRDCDVAPLFQMILEGVRKPWWLGSCAFTCAGAIDDACACPGSCAIDAVLRIDAGGTYETNWPGLVLEGAELPTECSNFCSGPCSIARQARAGTYQVQAEAHAAADCPDGDCVTCWDTGPGWCSHGGTVAGETLAGVGTLVYPGETGVEVVF